MRDLNDARVTFTTLATSYGLTLEQTKTLWRAVRPPYPANPEQKTDRKPEAEAAPIQA